MDCRNFAYSACINPFFPSKFLPWNFIGIRTERKIMPSSSCHKFTVPQRFFLHFYVLAVVWTTILVLATWFYAYKMAPLGSESLHYSMVASHLTEGSHNFSWHKSHSTSVAHRFRVWNSVFLLLLMEIHVVRRLYETVYVFKYRHSARMHIFGYLTGLFFLYGGTPVTLHLLCSRSLKTLQLIN